MALRHNLFLCKSSSLLFAFPLYILLVHPETAAEKENAGYIQLPEDNNDANNDESSISKEQQMASEVVGPTNPSPTKHHGRSEEDQPSERDLNAVQYSNTNLSFTENAGMYVS